MGRRAIEEYSALTSNKNCGLKLIWDLLNRCKLLWIGLEWVFSVNFIYISFILSHMYIKSWKTSSFDR